MADNNEAPPGLPRHEIDWKYGGMTVSRHGDWVRHSDAAAALSELRAEVERLRVDAERYRIVRENPSLTQERWEAIFLSPEEIDAAIDTARSAASGGTSNAR